ncbi:MAG: M16 family metallopeptidase [Chitinophagales bacterium]|jgi:predicted Zn-dependent peptidase
MTINRSTAPAIQPVKAPEIPKYRMLQLSNGLSICILDCPEYDILKLEVAFHAGRPEEKQKLTALMTPKLMLEGAAGRTGANLAEELDFAGATISSWSWLDATGFVVTGLSKYASQILPIVADVLLRPDFPERELQTLVQNHLQELQVELDKVEVLSYRILTEHLYGSGHPLGYNSTSEDYKALTRASIKAYYEDHLSLEKAFIIVSGNIDRSVEEALERCFGAVLLRERNPELQRSAPIPSPIFPKGKKTTLQVEHGSGEQASVKMGRLLFNRNHPDFYEMLIVNTIFGGYFGSRLMMNIREQKGFTYNIYSAIDTYYASGFFYISTEVNREKTAATIRAIRLEMKKMREKPVELEELEMVKNYMAGALLSSLDGPLNKSVSLRTILFEGMGKEGIDRQLSALKTITPKRIMELANLYLHPEQFLTVVVRPTANVT